MADVSWQRPELRKLLPIYSKIRDVLEGAEAIKGRSRVGANVVSYANGWENIRLRTWSGAMRYLPPPNPDDDSEINRRRYQSYVERAFWMGAAARTLTGMVGQVFQRDPDVKVPTELDALVADVDGSGLTLLQLMQRMVYHAIAYGRGGLFADYATTGGELTASDITDGKLRPTLHFYKPWQIVNWRVSLIDGQRKLTLVVLLDDDVYNEADEFEVTPLLQFKVLKLNNDGTHTVDIWKEETNSKQTARAATTRTGTAKRLSKAETYTPQDANGATFDEIPFTFLGSENNDAVPDKPPMEDLCEANIAHYRNSADYEDAVHLLGQPTPYATGLTENWVKNVWKGKQIPLGSRAVIPLPKEADMGMLQAAENSMVREAMLDKQDQMIQLGAKLIEPTRGAQTATGELIDEVSETSTLSNAANNVGAAVVFALQKAAKYQGVADAAIKDISVKLNTAFQFVRMDPSARQELVREWQVGAISFTEMRTGLRATGVATQDDKTAKDEIAKEIADRIATGAVADPFGPSSATGPGNIPTPPANQAPNPVPPVKNPPKGKGGRPRNGQAGKGGKTGKAK